MLKFKARVLVVLVAAAGFLGGSAAHAQFEKLDPFNKNNEINKWGVRPNDLPPFKKHKPEVSTLSGSGGGSTFQTGRVMLRNDYQGPVTVNLFHPSAPNTVYGTYVIPKDGFVFLGGPPVVAGSDWGIRISFPNGVVSRISYIRNVAAYNGQNFAVSATSITSGSR